MEQFIYVADKEMVSLLTEKRFKKLKEAATWADDHVLAHRPGQHTGSVYRRESSSWASGSGGSAPHSSSDSPPHGNSFSSKSFCNGKSMVGTPQTHSSPQRSSEGAAGRVFHSTLKFDN